MISGRFLSFLNNLPITYKKATKRQKSNKIRVCNINTDDAKTTIM